MTREQDWRIHEYMGNDLTGFTWPKSGAGDNAVKVTDNAVTWRDIPHYSTTWEGAGLVMEWIHNSEDMTFMLTNFTKARYRASVGGIVVFDHSAPQALANAYIAAMEERDQ